MSNSVTLDIRSYSARALRIFLVIFMLTVAQVLWAVLLSDNFSTSANGIVYFILLAGKVYYMLLEFMHLKHEKKFFNIALFSPTILMIIWFVVSFCYEGGAGLRSQKNLGYRRPDTFPKEMKLDEKAKLKKLENRESKD